jgi:hypothetical protein
MRGAAEIFWVVAALTFAFAITANAGDPAAEDSAVADTPDTNGINLDGTDANNADTANADTTGVNAYNASADSINADNVKIDAKSINTAKPDLDAAPPQLSGAYWGFGLGLSVGSVPIVPMWQKHVPGVIDSLGLSPAFGADSGDAASMRYRVTESPDAFNFTVPFSVSLYNIGETRVFSFTLSFFRNIKQFQSALSIDSDTAARRINVLETLAFYSVSIEAAGRLAIPPVFFSVDGSQQTLLTLAAGASPVNTFARESEIKTTFKDGDARMQAAADSVKKAFAAISGNGLSFSWRVGISTIKRYPSGSGIELGLFYSGAYSNYFYGDGVRLTEEHIKTRGADINAENNAGGKPLSFLSNQAEFKATFLVPTKK